MLNSSFRFSLRPIHSGSISKSSPPSSNNISQSFFGLDHKLHTSIRLGGVRRDNIWKGGLRWNSTGKSQMDQDSEENRDQLEDNDVNNQDEGDFGIL